MEYQKGNKLIEDYIKRDQETKGNPSLYIVYADSLHCDGFRFYAYKDGVNLFKEDAALLNAVCNSNQYYVKDALTRLNNWGWNYIEVTMVGDSAYYGTIGLNHALEIVLSKYPELEVKCFSLGYYTFPRDWKDVGDFFNKYLKLPSCTTQERFLLIDPVDGDENAEPCQNELE